MTREVEGLTRDGGRFWAHIRDVGDVCARAVVISSGVTYRRLGLPSLDDLTGHGVYYGTSLTAAHALIWLTAPWSVLQFGRAGGPAPGEVLRGSALGRTRIRPRPQHVGLPRRHHRGSSSHPRPPQYRGRGREGTGRLEQVRIRNRLTGDEQDISLESLFVMIGAHPRTSWVPPEVARDSYDFLVTGTDAAATSLWDLERRPHPRNDGAGVFAVGDVRGGSVKRVASAVGEGSVVVSEIHQYLATAPN